MRVQTNRPRLDLNMGLQHTKQMTYQSAILPDCLYQVPHNQLASLHTAQQLPPTSQHQVS